MPGPWVFCPVISLQGSICLVLRWTAYWGCAVSLEKQEANVYQIYHSHSQIESMAAANRTALLLVFLTRCSKFIAYLAASQNRNNSFQYVLIRKSTLPQNTTIITPHQIGQRFFRLPESAYQKSSCWATTEHTSNLQVPYLESHEGKQQQIPDAIPGDEMGPAACVHPSWLCNFRLQEPLQVQFLPQQKFTSPYCTVQLCRWPHDSLSVGIARDPLTRQRLPILHLARQAERHSGSFSLGRWGRERGPVAEGEQQIKEINVLNNCVREVSYEKSNGSNSFHLPSLFRSQVFLF